MGGLVIRERQDDLVPSLLKIGLEVVAILVPALLGFGRHRNADGCAFLDLVAVAGLSGSTAATGRETRAHRHARDDLLGELHVFSFIFEGDGTTIVPFVIRTVPVHLIAYTLELSCQTYICS